MYPKRLRNWMTRYGNGGVLLVGIYLVGYSVWTKRRAWLLCFPVVFLLLGGAMHGFLARRTQVRSASLRPIAKTSVAPPSEQVPQPPPELRSTQVIRIGQDRWRFEVWMPASEWELLKCFRNGKLVQSINSQDLGKDQCGQYFSMCLMHAPTRYPVLIVRVHAGAGEAQVTRFYALRNGKLCNVGEIEGPGGGPVLQNRGQDGKWEWVFDDYDPCYGPDHEGPEYYTVYKETEDGALRFWKDVPAKKRGRLPDPFISPTHWKAQ